MTIRYTHLVSGTRVQKDPARRVVKLSSLGVLNPQALPGTRPTLFSLDQPQRKFHFHHLSSRQIKKKVQDTRHGQRAKKKDEQTTLQTLTELEVSPYPSSPNMAPIPVYSSSPINAAKPTGVTPKTTTGPGESDNQGNPQPTSTSTLEVSSAGQAYPSAQPGARPSLPQQTPVSQRAAAATHALAGTPTQTASPEDDDMPPPPQPGAVPVPVPRSGTAQQTSGNLPPPPKAGEPVPVTTMPPQMAYQPPHASLPIQGRSSTATASPQAGPGGGAPTLSQGNYPSAGYSPPAAGVYQQDVNAAGYNQYQRSAAADEQQGETSVWDTAKKWAASAGESLAAAESEVWKRINKDE